MATMDTAGEPEQPEGPTERRDPVPAPVDWLLGILAGVFGLALTTVGLGMVVRVDRALLTEIATSDDVELNGITEAEFVDAAVPFVDWFAAGLVVTGLLMIIAVGAFVVIRQRTRRRVSREGGTTATFWACAVYGAFVTVIVSFIPGSAIVGGGAAAYLHDGDGIRTGAASGLVGSVFTVPLVTFLAAGFLAGAAAIGELVGGAVVVAILVVGELFAVALTVGFGALGGFLIDRFA